MTALYNIGIRIYYVLVLIVSPFKQKAKLWIEGRRGCLNKIQKEIDPNAEYAWFHVSSLGEFEQGRPVMEELRNRHPMIKIILTFFSPSGYEIRKNYEGADIVAYLPLDTKRNARKFIQLVKPKWTFFVKYEFWHHFLKQAHQSESKLFLVSGIFRDDQLFFKPYGRWYRKMLDWFDYFFVQNKESAEMLDSIGLKNVLVTGDTRFDRVIQIAQSSRDLEVVSKFAENSPVVVCGSTWEPDECILVNYLLNNQEKLKLIIAPHEIKKEKLENLETKLNSKAILFSKANKNNVINARVLIIDNIGMLSSLYKYGQVAYIGGGFGSGIHNTLEAAVYGVPVLFGPNYKKFQEAIALIDCGGAKCVDGFSSLEEVLDTYLSDKKIMISEGKAASKYVISKTGATNKIVEYLSD